MQAGTQGNQHSRSVIQGDQMAMPGMLSDLVDTAVGFRAAVNVAQELDDFEKAAALDPRGRIGRAAREALGSLRGR